MRIQAIIISLLLSLFPLATIADAGHSHAPVSQDQAEAAAIQSITRLIYRNKIDESWKTIGVMKSEKKRFRNHEEWVVSFKNEKISKPSERILYISLTLDGKFIIFNHSGIRSPT